MTVESWDVRDGGTWRYVHSDDEGNAYGFHGVFHGPQTPDGMLQTFEFGRAANMGTLAESSGLSRRAFAHEIGLDKLVFEDHGDTTVVRVHSVFQSIEARDAMIANGMADGVNDGYDRLDDLLARLSPVAAR